MLLTHTTRNNPNTDAFPTIQLLILGMPPISLPNPSCADSPLTKLAFTAICRVSEPIALASCFPYAWVMVGDFNVGDKSSASFWAGIFISSFALAESLTGLAWGGVSDKIGRKPVLLIGCAGTMISLLIVGFSTNFWMALAGRVMGGLLSEYTRSSPNMGWGADPLADGNIGVIQTMVGELVKKPEHERELYLQSSNATTVHANAVQQKHTP